MKRCLIALFLSISLFLTACSPTQSSNGDTVTVTDALGREVNVALEGMRVAALLGSIADVWCLAGGSLVAAPTDAWEDFALPLDGAVNVGGAHSPSLEKLLSAAPTLVLASASTASKAAR